MVLGYAICPLDLIPDFIPVLGVLDDLLLLPLGLYVARRLIPHELYREHASQITAFYEAEITLQRVGIAIIVTFWVTGLCIALAILYLYTIA